MAESVVPVTLAPLDDDEHPLGADEWRTRTISRDESAGLSRTHEPPQFDLQGRQLPPGKRGTGKIKRSGVPGKFHHGALAEQLPVRHPGVDDAPGAGRLLPPKHFVQKPKGFLRSGPLNPREMDKTMALPSDRSIVAPLVGADDDPQKPRYYNTQGKPLVPSHWERQARVKTRSSLQEKRRLDELPDMSYDIDGDGVVSPLDLFIAKQFDKDKNGYLTQEERYRAWEALQGGFANKFYVTRGGASSLDLRVQQDADGNVLATDLEGGRLGSAQRASPVRAPYAVSGPGGPLEAEADEPSYLENKVMSVATGDGSRRHLLQLRRMRDAVSLDDKFGGGVQVRSALQARRERSEQAAEVADKANVASTVAAARRALRMSANVVSDEELSPGAIAAKALDLVGTDESKLDGSMRLAVKAATQTRKKRVDIPLTRAERMLEAVDQANTTANVGELLPSRRRRQDDEESLGSVEERVKPYDDPARTAQPSAVSRRRLFRERAKEATRASLAFLRVSEEEFGLDERDSPRSEDGEFWEYGGHPLRSGGVTKVSKSRTQMLRRRRAATAAEGMKHATPGALGIHPAPLPSFDSTLSKSQVGWYELPPPRTIVQTSWEGSDLDGHRPLGSVAPEVANVTIGRGRRLDGATLRPLVADGLLREGDDTLMAELDAFKTRTIAHEDRPEVQRHKYTAFAAKPIELDHWETWRETGSGAPIDLTMKRHTLNRWTTAVIEHKMAEEKAVGQDTTLDENGKERFVHPSALAPMYSSFSPDGQFREPRFVSVEAVNRTLPKSPLQLKRMERALSQQSLELGGIEATRAMSASVKRRKERSKLKTQGLLDGQGTYLAKDEARVSGSMGSGVLPEEDRAGWTEQPLLHDPSSQQLDVEHPPSAAQLGLTSFSSMASAVQEFAESQNPAERKRRLWGEAHHRRAMATQSAPVLPRPKPSLVSSTGLHLLQ
jgi:hypothetical protein